MVFGNSLKSCNALHDRIIYSRIFVFHVIWFWPEWVTWPENLFWDFFVNISARMVSCHHLMIEATLDRKYVVRFSCPQFYDVKVCILLIWECHCRLPLSDMSILQTCLFSGSLRKAWPRWASTCQQPCPRCRGSLRMDKPKCLNFLEQTTKLPFPTCCQRKSEILYVSAQALSCSTRGSPLSSVTWPDKLDPFITDMDKLLI